MIVGAEAQGRRDRSNRRAGLAFVLRAAAVFLVSWSGARTLGAQSPVKQDSVSIPAAYRPPPGMCRIWLDGVPPERQPAPTDCVTAVRERPANGRVVFGEKLKESKPAEAPRLPRVPVRCLAGDSSSKPCASAPPND